MKIYVNNNPIIIENDITIEKLLQQLNQNTSNIAFAINQTIISRSQWQNFVINDNDRVTLITATAGG